MNSESNLLLQLWDIVGDNIPKSQRVDAVMSIFLAFQEYGIETTAFAEAIEEDAYLKSAYDLVNEEEEDEIDYDEEEEGPY